MLLKSSHLWHPYCLSQPMRSCQCSSIFVSVCASSKTPSSLIAIFGCFGSRVIHGVRIVFHSRCILSFHSYVNDGIHISTSVNSAAAVLRTPPPQDYAYATGNTNARAQCTEISIPKHDRHTYIPMHKDIQSRISCLTLRHSAIIPATL